MIKYDGLRIKAKEWRMEGLSLDEICQRLSLSKGTVHHWVKDIPLQRPKRTSLAAAYAATSKKFRLIREEAYLDGLYEYDALVLQPTFRDFVTLFMTEGYRRGKNIVSVANTNPNLIRLASFWMRRLSSKELKVSFQHYADHDVAKLQEYWSSVTGVAIENIRHSIKTNAGGLQGRNNRCVYGVVTVGVFDTVMRNRMQGWCDRIEDEWCDIKQSQDHIEGHLIWDQEYRAGADPAALTN